MTEVDKAMEENPVLKAVVGKTKRQQAKGLRKYGEFVTISSYSLQGWLQHFQEELIDALIYMECAIQKLREDTNAQNALPKD